MTAARAALALLAALALSGCKHEDAAAAKPPPVAMTAEAVGHYCRMDVLEHDGPKAQVHVAGLIDPIWFTQVRDAIAFARMPEETSEPVAIYVSDMSAPDSWRAGDARWIDADAAVFVIGSRRAGAMGAPEAVPFGSAEAAAAFVAAEGGVAVAFDEIPTDYVLAPVDVLARDDGYAGRTQ